MLVRVSGSNLSLLNYWNDIFLGILSLLLKLIRTRIRYQTISKHFIGLIFPLPTVKNIICVKLVVKNWSDTPTPDPPTTDLLGPGLGLVWPAIKVSASHLSAAATTVQKFAEKNRIVKIKITEVFWTVMRCHEVKLIVKACYDKTTHIILNSCIKIRRRCPM